MLPLRMRKRHFNASKTAMPGHSDPKTAFPYSMSDNACVCEITTSETILSLTKTYRYRPLVRGAVGGGHPDPALPGSVGLGGVGVARRSARPHSRCGVRLSPGDGVDGSGSRA